MNTYKRHRFPPNISSYAVWLYYRFNPSHRDIEDLVAERGITVSYETVPLWSIKFGAKYANNRVWQSHEATLVRARGMRKFKSMVQAQRFVTAHYRGLRVSAFNEWSRAVA